MQTELTKLISALQEFYARVRATSWNAIWASAR